MSRPKTDDTHSVPVAVAMCRGIYKRVATKLGLDESYVSRVATGQRKSPRVISAIQYELTLIRDYLNRTAGKSNGA